MKVAAIGDAHLGRSYYPATTPEGVNQREADFERSFSAAVELALAQAPDLVVWLGDIFDHPRPTFRSFRLAQRALARIREHGAAAVVITGNHDTPRLPGTGSPYSALSDSFPEFHFAHRLTYERFDLGGLVVHAVPQMLTVEATLEALDEADRRRSSDASNLLLTHPRITQVEPRYADINEIEVDAGLLRSDFVLLGHYHFNVEVAERIWYAGSTDTFSFADDPDKPKGILLLDTDTGACRHIALADQRPLVTLPTVEALGLSPAELSGPRPRAGLPDTRGSRGPALHRRGRRRGLPPARPRRACGPPAPPLCSSSWSPASPTPPRWLICPIWTRCPPSGSATSRART